MTTSIPARRLPDLDRRPRTRLAFRLPAMLDTAPLGALIRHRDECAVELAARHANIRVAEARPVADYAAICKAHEAYWLAYARWNDACEAVARATPRDAAADEMPTCADPLTRGATR